MDKKGLLIVVCGPSGVGKGTICKTLLEHRPEIKLSISATTREKRIGEIHGENYFFIKRDEFEKMISNDEFFEYAEVYDNLYGTPEKYVLEEIEKGNDVLLEIDIQGAMQVKKKYPNGVYIFLLPPSMEELKQRIVGRGTDTKESIEQRLNCANKEIDYIKNYDYYIINDNIENAMDRLIAIIIAEKCRVDEDIQDIINKYKEEV